MANAGLKSSVGFQLAPGESNVVGETFMPSLLVPYLKGRMMCSDTRFVYQVPNTFLGIIPVGNNKNTVPIKSIAAVNTNTTVKPLRALIGLILLIIAFTSIGSGDVGKAFLMALLGVIFLAVAFPATLTIVNHAGGQSSLTVAAIEKKKLDAFNNELQNRVFANVEQIHHDEAQSMRQMQAQLQMMQLQNAQMQQQYNAAQQAGQPQPPVQQ